AKAHGLDGEEVGLGADLARGMALERERRLLRRHALPVVRHPDGAPPGLLNVHRYASGPGVDGVLHQFLHHGGGPLDDFAGGDLVDDVAREDRDSGRHRSSASRRLARAASADCGYSSTTRLSRTRALTALPSSA